MLFRPTQTRKELDVLFDHVPPASAPLSQRLGWLRDLMHWILSEGALAEKSPGTKPETTLTFQSGYAQAARVKWVLFVIERNPEWGEQLKAILRSVASETSILELLIRAGLHQKSGLISETLERISRRILPHPPDDANLEQFFQDTFTDVQAAKAIKRIDDESFRKVIALFADGEDSVFAVSSWSKELEEATEFLSTHIASLGLDAAIRERIESMEIGENPFAKLHHAILKWRRDRRDQESFRELNVLIPACVSSIDDVYTHMDDHGVSVDLVYRLERILALLKRLELILSVFQSNHSTPSIKFLLSSVIFQSARSRSLLALFDDNTTLIAKKIAENSAETGDHYIARSGSEAWQLFKSALGGGAITAVTTLFKFLIAHLPASPFVLGIFNSVNYSISFIYLQLQGLTLATKQPAMTAARLAHEMDPENLNWSALISEILRLVRSQVIAVIGNLAAVIPCVMLISFTLMKLTGDNFVSEAKAIKTMDSFSIFGATPFYAAWTGVLLFLSSLFAGWFYHWTLYRKLPQALGRNQYLVQIWGAERTRKFGHFFKKNAAGFASNISLALLLGLSPVIFEFIGLPLDVRHVTLSTGSLAASVMTLGHEVFTRREFWQAVVGILSMGVLNLSVSFSLALIVALRSKRIPFDQARALVWAVTREILLRPWLLIRHRA